MDLNWSELQSWGEGMDPCTHCLQEAQSAACRPGQQEGTDGCQGLCSTAERSLPHTSACSMPLLCTNPALLPNLTPAHLLPRSSIRIQWANTAPCTDSTQTEALSPAPAPPSLSALQLPALEQQPGAALSHSMLSASHAAIHRFLVYFSFSERHVWFKPTTSEIESNMAITDHPHRLWGHHREHRWDAGEGAGGLAPPGGSHQLQILIGLYCAGG